MIPSSSQSSAELDPIKAGAFKGQEIKTSQRQRTIVLVMLNSWICRTHAPNDQFRGEIVVRSPPVVVHSMWKDAACGLVKSPRHDPPPPVGMKRTMHRRHAGRLVSAWRLRCGRYQPQMCQTEENINKFADCSYYGCLPSRHVVGTNS